MNDGDSTQVTSLVPSIATFTRLELGQRPRVQALFPGRDRLPGSGTAGYVRSPLRSALADPVRVEMAKRTGALAWRDYPDDVLTPVGDVLASLAGDRDHLLISARNTLNELGYQARLSGCWYRRRGDHPPNSDWPVLCFDEAGLQLLQADDAIRRPNDLITGLPLVIDGQAMSRAFFIYQCSDMAHVFEVDPQGRLGPSQLSNPSDRRAANSRVWQDLSDGWQDMRNRNVEAASVAAELEHMAETRGVQQSRHLLHSLIAQRHDGSIVAFAISGALHHISRHISRSWNVQHAVLLDNSGSVGWLSRLARQSDSILLVAGPNYRPRGTVFLDISLPEFMRPSEHPALLWNRQNNEEQ